jgi:peroxiredoxin
MTRPGERTVTLHDGRQVSSWSEEFRHECEALAIINMPTLSQRRAHLYGIRESVKINGQWVMKLTTRGVLQIRGPDEVKRLESTMTALWEKRRSLRARIDAAAAAG